MVVRPPPRGYLLQPLLDTNTRPSESSALPSVQEAHRRNVICPRTLGSDAAEPFPCFELLEARSWAVCGTQSQILQHPLSLGWHSACAKQPPIILCGRSTPP